MRTARRAGAMAMTAVAGFAVLAAVALAQSVDKDHQKTGAVVRGVARPEAQPPSSLRVTLSVYSGRPNPTWILEKGPELERLVALLRELKPTESRLFDYDEWNRLGYATFRLSARDLPGVPNEVHVWRDMAVVPSKDGKTMQATGASKVYEALVTEAEGKGHERFFANYRKLPPPGKPRPR